MYTNKASSYYLPVKNVCMSVSVDIYLFTSKVCLYECKCGWYIYLLANLYTFLLVRLDPPVDLVARFLFQNHLLRRGNIRVIPFHLPFMYYYLNCNKICVWNIPNLTEVPLALLRGSYQFYPAASETLASTRMSPKPWCVLSFLPAKKKQNKKNEINNNEIMKDDVLLDNIFSAMIFFMRCFHW